MRREMALGTGQFQKMRKVHVVPTCKNVGI